MKSAIYVRVSTLDQDTDMQLRECVAYCERSGFQFDIYSDKMSGTSQRRPELNRMLVEIDAGKYSRLIVWKLDRFSRSVRDLIDMLSRVQCAGCDFISLRESLDFSSAVGRMQVQLLAVFAEFESAMTRERTRAGLAAARARGVRLGVQPKVIDLDELRYMRAGGVSMGEIAEHVGLSVSQVYRRLSKTGF